MSEVADSMLFRQKLYDTFKESGLLSKLKTTLRSNLLQKLQKPSEIPQPPSEDKSLPFHLRNKFIESAIAELLRAKGKEYSLSIFMAECDLQEEDCLRFGELSQIINLNTPAGNESFLFHLFEEFGKIKCMEAQERSTQTDFDEPLSKKLETIEKGYRTKMDYWKLIPGSSLPKSSELIDQEERLRGQFAAEKERLKRELQVSLKQQIEKKLDNQYNFRLHEAQKLHETRLNQLKQREKAVLDRLHKQKADLEQKCKQIREEERRLINKYEERLQILEAEYRCKMKELQAKEKEFWRKELQVRAKKREYEETIRLVKQKVVAESAQ